MQFVKLVVPQHLYEELKLRPNQIILLSNSENAYKPDSSGISVSTAFNSKETSNQHREPLLIESDNYQDWRTSKPFHENPGVSVLTLLVNTDYGTQKILTYHLKSIEIVPNVRSELNLSEPECNSTCSENRPTSLKEMNPVICDFICVKPQEIAMDLGTHYSDDGISVISQETSSQHHETLLSEPKDSEKGSDGKSGESLEYQDDSITAEVNTINGKQEIVTCNVKSTSSVINEHETSSKNSDDVNIISDDVNVTCDDESITCDDGKSGESMEYLDDLVTAEVNTSNSKQEIVTCNEKSTSSVINEHETSSKKSDDVNITSRPQEPLSQNHELLLSEPKGIHEVYGKSGECIRECVDDSFVADKITRNANQEILNYNLKSTSCVSNERDGSTKNPGSVNTTSRESNPGVSGSSVGEKIKYPRICTKCNRSYAQKYSYKRHLKTCAVNGFRKKIIYPRTCELCKRTYRFRASFSQHKPNCERFRLMPSSTTSTTWRAKLCSLCGEVLDCVSALSIHQAECLKRFRNDKNGSGEVKLWQPSPTLLCSMCGKYFDSWSTLSKHKVECLKRFTNDKEGSDGVKIWQKPGDWTLNTLSSKNARYLVVKKKTTSQT